LSISTDNAVQVLQCRKELELELIQTHMTQKPMRRVEVGKGRLCGLLSLSLGDSKSIYCFSALKQQKTEDITPDQRAFLFLVETTGTIATRVRVASSAFQYANGDSKKVT
jgi:hypothetical protein